MRMILVLLFLVRSALAETVCYEPCGCFNDLPPFNDRPLPESPEENGLIWRVYTLSNPNIGQDIHWDDIPEVYDPSKKTVFLIHGWLGEPYSKERAAVRASNIEIKDAFMDGGYDYNVITVDWNEGASALYSQSASNTQVVGACSGHLAEVLTDVGTVHCVGHSLGGQTCGYMGKHLNGDLGRATGMDPAGPLFEVDDVEVRLDATDAIFVDTMHTNSLGLGVYGSALATADVDFYPHNGGRQPGCATDLCDHWACTDYFLASVAERDCEFLSFPCDDYETADLRDCGTCSEQLTCQNMGYYADTYPGTGTFYLEVNALYPYCQD